MSSAPRTPSPASYWSGYDLLWGLQEPGPTRRTAIDRSQIVAAAIEIADSSGLAAVTMRSVAASLGTAPMSLYRHVPDKDALVSLMVDAAIRPSDGDDEWPISEGWREQLRLIATSTWQLCRRHRWFPEASMVRPPITPSGIAGFELALSIFDGTGLDIGTKAQFVTAVYSTVIASALNTITEENARARLQMTEAEVHAAGAPFIMRMMTSGEYPRVSAYIIEAEHLDSEARMNAAVELILDGIAARLGALDGAVLLSKTSSTRLRRTRQGT
jgi:AcrR family transcriptional regulator